MNMIGLVQGARVFVIGNEGYQGQRNQCIFQAWEVGDFEIARRAKR